MNAAPYLSCQVNFMGKICFKVYCVPRYDGRSLLLDCNVNKNAMRAECITVHVVKKKVDKSVYSTYYYALCTV